LIFLKNNVNLEDMFNFNIVISLIIILLVGSSDSKAFSSDLEIDQVDITATGLEPGPFVVKEYGYSILPARYPTIEITPKFSWPVKQNIIDSGYGNRSASCSACSSFHQGIDFAHKPGTPVFAASDGLVSQLEYSVGFGLHIYIDHIVTINGKAENWRTVYAHLKLNSIPENVFVGAVVMSGQHIGGIGNTGTSTGPHLHFEIQIDGEAVDPEPILINFVTP
jgi:murein DD-endopeptidase MepM/ murein hydrolase activator NlpD